MFLQLQRLSDDKKTNLGGLYINVKHISAIYKEEGVVKDFNGYTKALCKIVMSNGIEYITVQTISEVLDEITEFNQRKNKFQK